MMTALFHVLLAVHLTTTVPQARAATVIVAQLPPNGAMSADSADGFVRAIGVDTHFAYRNTSYVILFGPVSQALLASGITRIRDGGSPSSDYLQRLAFLHEHGIDHSAEIVVGTQPDAIRERLARYGVDAVNMVEPQNEYDSHHLQDPLWLQNIMGEQRTIWNTLHGVPLYSGVTIVGPSMASLSNYPKLAGVEEIEDAASVHDGTCDREPETAHASHALLQKHVVIRTTTPTKPIWTTETGYGDNLNKGCGLPDYIIARYDPRVIAYRWINGERAIYFYQLVDMPNDRVFGSTGLLNADATAKPQFTAITSMIRLLQDPGPSFAPQPVNISIDEVPGVQHLLLAKRDGRYDLMLWLGVRSWDERHHVPLAVTSENLKVRFPDSVHSVVVYRYNSDWTLSGQSESLTDHVLTMKVDDLISFIELKP